MLYTAATHDGPAAVRYPRGQGPGTRIEQAMVALPIGRAEIRREGRSGLLLLGFGTMVAACTPLAERLDATLVNMRFVKPLDAELLGRLVPAHSAVVTIEENVVAGGAGSAVNELLTASGIARPSMNVGLPDTFIEHGSRDDCLEMAGLDAASLERTITAFWRGLQPARPLVAAGHSAG